MNKLDSVKNKILSQESLLKKVEKWKHFSQKIVFTNGCFDILHRGHIEVLAKTADMGDKLIVALNSDISIKQLKGEGRPVFDQYSRSLILASLEFVDIVILFSEKTPIKLIEMIVPDYLVKGGDYISSEIAGSDFVINNGGEVITIPIVEGYSTSNIINIIKES